MTKKQVSPSGAIENTTDTEIQVLKSIEKAFYDNNPSSVKRNTQKSLTWFSQYVPRAYNKIRTSQVMRDADTYSDMIIPGNMYFFVYDALHADVLPIWDAFPLVFPWDVWTKDGVQYFVGINLHFLSPRLRLKAMQALLTLRNRKSYRPNVKLKISWQILKAMSESKLFKHCVKMYRMDRVRSRFIKVPPASWELALFLPTQRFQKGSSSEAWKI